MGVLVLLGWVFDLPVLKSVLPGYALMKVSTALGFIVAGSALLLRLGGTPQGQSWSKGLAAVLVWRGGLRIFGSATGMNLALDQWLIPDDSPLRGSMVPLIALNFVLVGTAVFALGSRWRGRWPSEWLAVAVGSSALLTFLGYVFDAPASYLSFAFKSVAIHTSVRKCWGSAKSNAKAKTMKVTEVWMATLLKANER
jgi:hypothetical protein